MNNFTLLQLPGSGIGSPLTANGSVMLDANVAYCIMLAVDVNLSAPSGTTPTITFSLDRQGADGVWYPIWTSAQQSAAGKVSASVGAGMATAAIWGHQVRLSWTITGAGASWPFTASVLGR